MTQNSLRAIGIRYEANGQHTLARIVWLIMKFRSDPYTYIFYCALTVYFAAVLLGYVHMQDACVHFDACS